MRKPFIRISSRWFFLTKTGVHLKNISRLPFAWRVLKQAIKKPFRFM